MRSLFFAAAMIALTGAALAQDDPMASRYGNTTIATDPDGSQTKIYYRADHTFTATHGFWKSEGTWSVEDGKLCLTYQNVRPKVGSRECVSAEAHNIGDKWRHNGRSITLVEGLQ